MKINNYQQDKITALRNYLSDKLAGKIVNVKEIFQVKPSVNTNNKYRSSSPWTLLFAESLNVVNDAKFTQNDKFLCGFEFENNQLQNLVDAAFSKSLFQIVYNDDLDENETREKVINYLISHKTMFKNTNEIIKTLKKLNVDLIFDY